VYVDIVILVDMSPGARQTFIVDRDWLQSMSMSLFDEFLTKDSLRVSLMLATPSCKVLVNFDQGRNLRVFEDFTVRKLLFNNNILKIIHAILASNYSMVSVRQFYRQMCSGCSRTRF